MMMKILPITFLFAFSLHALDPQIVENGPIHEAFISQEYGNLILRAVQEKPPLPIQELVPGEAPSEYMEWIPGYWEWSEQEGEYLWISGIWRDPPPGRQWMAGKWIESAEGWVRAPGFWSSGEFSYIPRAAPDPLDEEIPRIPALNCFWILGNWEYDAVYKRYDWRQGRWQLFDSHWVYMPSQTLWRPDGFISVEGYWDRPLDERGKVYATVHIDPEVRDTIIYEPKNSVDLAEVIVTLFPYWPNYLYFFHTFAHFHPEFWAEWQVEVPWWGWEEWWCFTWKDQLALWWWWSHPGFPQPFWMYPRLAEQITAPSKGIVNLMRTKEPQKNITAFGVVGDQFILDEIGRFSKSKAPILSNQIEEEIEKKMAQQEVKRPFLLPYAPSSPEEEPKKPFFGPKEDRLSHPPKRILVPETPPRRVITIKTEESPKLFKKKRPPFPHSNQDEIKWPPTHMPEFPHSNVEQTEEKKR